MTIARLMILALLLLTGAAHAQFACDPGPDGGGTALEQRTHADGTFATWHCPSRYDWSSQVIVARSGYVPTIPDLSGMTAAQMVAAVLEANVQASCASPPADLAGLCQAALEAAAERKPAPPRYVVAPNARAVDDPATRPMYRRTDAGLGSVISGRRAPVGAPCWCWYAAVEQGGNSYCSLADEHRDRDALTICVPE